MQLQITSRLTVLEIGKKKMFHQAFHVFFIVEKLLFGNDDSVPESIGNCFIFESVLICKFDSSSTQFRQCE